MCFSLLIYLIISYAKFDYIRCIIKFWPGWKLTSCHVEKWPCQQFHIKFWPKCRWVVINRKFWSKYGYFLTINDILVKHLFVVLSTVAQRWHACVCFYFLLKREFSKKLYKLPTQSVNFILCNLLCKCEDYQ
jgi:hypothetical protein